MKHTKTHRALALLLLCAALLSCRFGAPPASAYGFGGTWVEPMASGDVLLQNTEAVVDASNVSEGYVMIRVANSTSKGIKVIITAPTGRTYTYNLNGDGVYETFPLTEGSGSYKVVVYKNIAGDRYSTLYATTVDARIKDALPPYSSAANTYALTTARTACRWPKSSRKNAKRS